MYARYLLSQNHKCTFVVGSVNFVWINYEYPIASLDLRLIYFRPVNNLFRETGSQKYKILQYRTRQWLGSPYRTAPQNSIKLISWNWKRKTHICRKVLKTWIECPLLGTFIYLCRNKRRSIIKCVQP